MAEIKLIRADFRLIHGQVITKWIKQVTANKILIVNDELAQDEFMASIYEMAAPSGIKVQILSIEQAVKKWKEDSFGNDQLFVLFKDILSISQAYEKGFPIRSLQIGGLGGGPGRQNVMGPISFDESDIKQLDALEDQGVEVYLHVLPTEPRMEYKKAVEKIKNK